MAINIGDINFGLGADTRRLEASIKAVLDFGRAVNSAAKSQVDGARQAEAALRKQEKALIDAYNQTVKLNDEIRRTGASSGLLQTTTNNYNRLTRELGQGRVSALQYQRSMEDFSVSTTRVNRALKEHQDQVKAANQAQRDAAAFDKAYASAQQENTRRNREFDTAYANAYAENRRRMTQEDRTYARALADNDKINKQYDRMYNAANAENVRRDRAENATYYRAQADNAKIQATAVRDAAKASRDAETALIRQEAAIFKVNEAYKALEAAAINVKAPSLATPARAAMSNVVATYSNPLSSRVDQQRSMQMFTSAIAQARREISAIDTSPVSKLHQILQQTSAAAVLIAGPLSGIATRISIISNTVEHFNVATAGFLAGVAGASYAMYKLGEASIDVAKKLQNVEQTLTAVFADKTIGQTSFKWLNDLADRAGQQFAPLAKQFSQITAAAKGTNLEGERTNKIFEAIVFAGAKLGLSSQDVEGTLRAVQQIMSKGTVQAEELRGQLGDRLPGAMQIMADALGVTTVKLDGMLKKGEVGRSALVAFAEQLKKRFGIDTAQNIDTIVAAENRLSNARVRALDTIDKTIGFSQAYVVVLNKLTSGLDYLSERSGVLIRWLGAIAGGLIGLATPAILAGFAALGAGIVSLTASVIGLNTALLANPIGGIAMLALRLGITIAGAAAGYELMSRAIGQTQQSLLTSLPAVDAYIKAQETLKTSVRNATLEYIEQVKTQQKAIQSRMMELGAIDPSKITKDQVTEYNNLIAASKKAQENIVKLNAILKKQTDEENKAKPDPLKDLTNSQAVAIKNANDTIRELGQKYDFLYKSPAQQDFLQNQLEINKAVEDFRDKLQRSLGESPQGKGQIDGLVNRYREALTKVKNAELDLKRTQSYFQVVEGVFSRGLDNATSKFVDNIVEGKNAWQDFGSVGQQVLADLLKTLLTMAALNPLKNALFGTNYAVLGGTAGTGGLLGDVAKWFGFSGGGIMTADGPLPLRKYAGGGIANSPQLAMFGEGSVPEAYVPVPNGKIPVQLSGGANNGGGGNVYITVNEAPGTKAQVSQKRRGNNVDISVTIRKIAIDGFIDDLNNGGPAASAVEARYGLNRTAGMTS